MTKAKILHYLNENPDLQHQPKTIARELKINHNTVRVYCRNLFKNGDILQPLRGLYQSKNVTIKPNNARYHELKLHRLHIISDDLSQFVTMKGVGVPFCNFDITTMPHRDKTQKSINQSYEVDGRWYKFKYHYLNMKKIEIISKTTDNPLDYYDFRSFCSFLKGMHPNIPLSSFKICEIEFNIDIRVFGLSEKCTTLNLKLFENAWFKMYQKTKDMIRVETYLTERIDMAKAIQILYKFVETVDNEYMRVV